MVSREQPVVMITGASSGLGYHIAARFLEAEYRVVLVGRDADRLEEAVARLPAHANGVVLWEVCDVTEPQQVTELLARIGKNCGRLDVLVNCVGASDRGLIEKLTPARLDELIRINVHTALLCSQAAIPLLETSGGVIVNIGSLASKVGSRYIGGYAIAKHALAGMTQQMRLELKSRGIHVALVNPGPIVREDSGRRYESKVDSSLPAQALRPGGGTSVKGLRPEQVADAVYRAVQRRAPDLVRPSYLRILIAIGHAMPRLGDWLLLRLTRDKPN